MPGLSGTASPMQQPAPRFAHGEQVTIVIKATVDSEHDAAAPGGGTVLMLGVRLPDGRLLSVPAGYPGIKVIHGDITPTLLHGLADALVYHDEGRCGDREHLGWVENYERAVDALDGRPVLASAPPG
jgi:hypothetical protein